VNHLPLEVDVLEIEPDGLGAAQAGRVDELDQRAVAKPERTVAAEPLEERVHLGRLWRRRQSPRALRRERHVGYTRRPERGREQRPDRGELPRDARRRELRALPTELRGVFGQHAHVDCLDREPARREPRAELLQVAAIGLPRRVGQCGAREKAVDRLHPDEFALRGETPTASRLPGSR